MQGSYVTYLSFAATVESLLFVWAPFFIVDFNFLSWTTNLNINERICDQSNVHVISNWVQFFGSTNLGAYEIIH